MTALARTSRPTALYRFYASSAKPLYFGITNNPKTRFAQHRRQKDWWPDVDHARTVITWFDSREEAEAAELAAIRKEQPTHNVVTADVDGCARFLPAPTGRRWGRPAWTPPNDEVSAKIQHVVELNRRRLEAKAQYKRALAAVADPDGRAVPITHLAEQIGVERKTVYRHLGRSMT